MVEKLALLVKRKVSANYQFQMESEIDEKKLQDHLLP